jgi:hypothetical protein
MHPDTRNVAKAMREFGLATLGRATYDLTFSLNMHPYSSSMAIITAGHGAELVLKARIAEEHPLLLFSQLPRSTTTSTTLTVAELFEHGRTVQFNDLPELLWATTGIRMDRVDQFQRFGRLRNAVVHFGLPEKVDWSSQTLKFLFEVKEPVVFQFWQESIASHGAEWDEVMLDGHLQDQLDQAEVEISPQLRAILGASGD